MTGPTQIMEIENVVAYDASKHYRPADFNADLEGLDDPDLEPLHNPRQRYMQWLQEGRPSASDVTFALDVRGTSFDLNYGVVLGVEIEDGRK
jgi:hypothetical protein